VLVPSVAPARSARSLFTTSLITSLLLASAVACSHDNPTRDQGSTPTTSRPVETVSRPHSPPATTAEPDDAAEHVLPDPLVGTWESAEGDATIAYQFTPDGLYKYVGILTSPTPDGLVQITFVAQGTARTDGETLHLQPARATMSREDPGDPAGNYTDRPRELTPEEHIWEVTVDDVLHLTDAQGLRITYQRQTT
jgi:hypothetical protein